MNALRSFAGIAADIIFPSYCVLCGRPTGAFDYPLCIQCESGIKTPVNICPICSGTVAEGECVFCAERHFYPQKNISLMEYKGGGAMLLQHFKFGAKRKLAHYFAGRAMPLLSEIARPDIVTSVPMRYRKMQKRGYNQAEEFGRAIAGKIGVPYARLLAENRAAKNQKTLDYCSRFFNTFGRFRTINSGLIPGKIILLTDDVFTTGSTVNECARILEECGAEAVFSVTIARADVKKLDKYSIV